MNAITKIDNAVARFLTQEKIDLIKRLYCKDASDIELRHFLDVCESRRLDPVLKQIYAVFRFSKKDNKKIMSIQVGIDGLRALAARTGEYAGNDAAVFEWSEDEDRPPICATVAVYRMVKGQRCAFAGEAYWDEYFPKDEASRFFWNQMPKGQLAKCAESLALRKAFPSETSGLYESSEMNQAGFESPESHSRPLQNIPPETIRPPECAQKNMIAAPPETAVDPTAPLDSFFTPRNLSEFTVPYGKYKGTKLKDLPSSDWQIYINETHEKLSDPDFPKDLKGDAARLCGTIEDYLAGLCGTIEDYLAGLPID